MAAYKPVGAGVKITATNSNVVSSSISQQSKYLRVVATGAAAHVEVGAAPTASATTFFLAQDVPEVISLGQVRSQPIANFGKGSTTTITFYEGRGSQFVVGDWVTLTAPGQTGFAFSHQEVTAINDASGLPNANQGFGRIITIDYDSSSVSGTWDTAKNPQSDLRAEFKVDGLSADFTNADCYAQQCHE